jgi:hypothetical protein
VIGASHYSTPPEVADELRVDPAKVLGWIRSGQLRAVNVGDGARRPRYRISGADLQVFLAARSAGPAPRVSRIRRRQPQGVTEFF